MLLYHGTSSTNLLAIKGSGVLSSPYLTDDWDIAQYYAEVTADELGGEPVVLEVEVDEFMLLPDTNAIAEPVLRDEAEVMEAFDIIPDNWKSQPDAWKVTMDLVSAVCVRGDVPVTI